MRLAILVLAYRSPVVLRATVEMFAGTDTMFFVHLDARADLASFAADLARPDILFIPDRQTVYWGGFNMVLAEFALLRAALQHRQYDRLLLISDDSAPIKPIPSLLQQLAAPALWIGQHAAPEYRWRYDSFVYFDSDATNPHFIPAIHRVFGERECADLQAMLRLRDIGKKPLARVLHGAQWWCLSAEIAAAILARHDADAHLRESFRFSALPDEQYLQTLVGLCAPQHANRGPPMFTDFSRDPKPYLFTAFADLAPALASPRLFARKLTGTGPLLAELAAHLAS